MLSKKERENIIKSLEIEDLPEKDQDEIMKKLEENIKRRVVLAVLNTISKEDGKKINSDSEDFLLFLKSKKNLLEPLIREVAVSTVNEFKDLKSYKR